LLCPEQQESALLELQDELCCCQTAVVWLDLEEHKMYKLPVQRPFLLTQPAPAG